jgi:hypothetical protein
MKVPTFYSSHSLIDDDKGVAAYIIRVMMSFVGIVFGGIHCIGWFFNFPSSDEAMLWRVSSAVLTGIAILFPILSFLLAILETRAGLNVTVAIIMLLVYKRQRRRRSFHFRGIYDVELRLRPPSDLLPASNVTNDRQARYL